MELYITQFGAVADGVTMCTDAINETINKVAEITAVADVEDITLPVGGEFQDDVLAEFNKATVNAVDLFELFSVSVAFVAFSILSSSPERSNL